MNIPAAVDACKRLSGCELCEVGDGCQINARVLMRTIIIMIALP